MRTAWMTHTLQLALTCACLLWHFDVLSETTEKTCWSELLSILLWVWMMIVCCMP